jgi:hypothetical protein
MSACANSVETLKLIPQLLIVTVVRFAGARFQNVIYCCAAVTALHRKFL